MILNVRGLCAAGFVCVFLGGCNSGTDTGATSGAATNPETINDSSRSTAGATANAAPTLSGIPATGVAAGATYSFQPASQDADGDTLQFSIAGKPAWATFSVTTGMLSGTPSAAEVGTYDNIVIAVSDGETTTAQNPFSIDVTAAEPASAAGTAVLSWMAPEHNTDATPITDVAGYRVYHGLTADALTDVREITSPDITSYMFEGLTAGTHFFAVSTYTHDGVESEMSDIISKTIP